jgi:hypothetical protein
MDSFFLSFKSILIVTSYLRGKIFVPEKGFIILQVLKHPKAELSRLFVTPLFLQR